MHLSDPPICIPGGEVLGSKDITEKTLEAYNDVFADIVNGLLFQGRPVIQEYALTDAQPFSMYKADGKLHEQERDVAKYWNQTSSKCISVRIAFLGFENQTKYEKDLPLRVIGYDGAAYRAELSQDDRYPVITLVLYFGDERWGKNRSIYDTIEIPKEFMPYVSDYRINVFEIAHLPEEAINYFHSDFRIVVDYFVHKRENPDYRPTDPDAFKHVDEVLKLLAALTHDDRFVEVLDEEGGKPRNMCEVLDRVEAKGEARGEARGEAKGIDKARLESIKNVMEGLKYTAQQAMDLLKIPSAERAKYFSKLNG